MKTEQIKKYKEFIDRASIFYWDFLKKDFSTFLILDEAKDDFSKEVFQEQYQLFENELYENMQLYSDNDVIAEYIKSQFKEFAELPLSVFNHKSEIIRNDFEIEFLLNMEISLAECNGNMFVLMYYDQFKHHYPDLTELRKQNLESEFALSTIESSYIEIEQQTQVPAKDQRFNFTLLKNEIEEIPDLIDKIKLIKRRMHELSAWEIQYDKLDYTRDLGNYNIYSPKYYPNFRELCELEINHIEEEIKLEERRKKSTTQQQMVQTVTLPRQKLQWTKSSREFVKTFHRLIEDKKISLNGNYDLEPIARVLLETFDIPKGKGAGFVNEESMLTYFRKENAGDVY